MGQPFGHQLIIGRIDHPHAGEASRLENRCGDNKPLLSKPYSSQFTSWPRKTLMPAPLMQLLPLCRSIDSRNPSPQKYFQKAVLVTKCSLVAVYFGVSATICFKLSRNSKKHRMFLSRVILRSWAFVKLLLFPRLSLAYSVADWNPCRRLALHRWRRGLLRNRKQPRAGCNTEPDNLD